MPLKVWHEFFVPSSHLPPANNPAWGMPRPCVLRQHVCHIIEACCIKLHHDVSLFGTIFCRSWSWWRLIWRLSLLPPGGTKNYREDWTKKHTRQACIIAKEHTKGCRPKWRGRCESAQLASLHPPGQVCVKIHAALQSRSNRASMIRHGLGVLQ